MGFIRYCLCGLLFALVFALPHSVRAQTKVKVVSAATVFDSSQVNNTSVPMHLGYWKSEGLDVEAQPSTASAAIQAIMTGNAEIAYGGPSVALAAREKGAKITAIYLNVRKNIYYPSVLDDSDIRSIRDFKGKMMGVSSYGAQMNLIFSAMFEEAGLDPAKDVKTVEVGMGSQALTALTSGRVQIWGTWDSQAATIENLGFKVRKFTSPLSDGLNFGAAYFVRDDYLKKNREALVKFLRGVAKGTVFALANPEAGVRIHFLVFPNSKPTGVDEQTAFKQALHIFSARAPSLAKEPSERWGEMSVQSVAATKDFLLKAGLLKKDFNPTDVFTNDLIDAANQFDEQAVRQQAINFK